MRNAVNRTGFVLGDEGVANDGSAVLGNSEMIG